MKDQLPLVSVGIPTYNRSKEPLIKSELFMGYTGT